MFNGELIKTEKPCKSDPAFDFSMKEKKSNKRFEDMHYVQLQRANIYVLMIMQTREIFNPLLTLANL